MSGVDPSLRAERLRLLRLAQQRRMSLRAAARELREPLREGLRAAQLLPRLVPEIGAALCAVLLLRQLQQRRYGGLWLLAGVLDLWRLYRALRSYRSRPALPPPPAS